MARWPTGLGLSESFPVIGRIKFWRRFAVAVVALTAVISGSLYGMIPYLPEHPRVPGAARAPSQQAAGPSQRAVGPQSPQAESSPDATAPAEIRLSVIRDRILDGRKPAMAPRGAILPPPAQGVVRGNERVSRRRGVAPYDYSVSRTLSAADAAP